MRARKLVSAALKQQTTDAKATRHLIDLLVASGVLKPAGRNARLIAVVSCVLVPAPDTLMTLDAVDKRESYI